MLFSQEEVKRRNLFGTGKNHDRFDISIGDYLAVATGDKELLSNPDCLVLKSNHAGLTPAEMRIPLILVECD